MAMHLRSWIFGPILAILAASAVAAAEPLPRRAYFGLSGEPDAASDGLRIIFVDPNATAGAAGFREDDILLSLNGDRVASMQDLIVLARMVRAGDDVQFTIKREGVETTLSAPTVERPREEADGVIVEYGAVDIANGRSRTVIYRPPGDGPFPALFYIQGFSCGSIDFGGASESTIRLFAEDVARAGFVVFRQEKHGVGDSVSETPCVDVDFKTEVDAFASGYAALQSNPYVDASNVFVFGHSLGGMIAPAFFDRHAPRGVIVYGSPTRRWFEYTIDVYEKQPALIGRNERSAKEKAKIAIPFLKDVMTTDLGWPEIEARHKEAIKRGVSAVEGRRILYRDFTFLRTLNQFDVAAAWRGFSGDALSVYGTYDIQVISEEEARRLLDLVGADGQGSAELLVLEKADHGLSRIELSFRDYALKVRKGEWTGADAAARYDGRIAAKTVEWMDAIRGTDSQSSRD